MDSEWYFRLLIPYMGWFICSFFLFAVIKAKRMTSTGPGKSFQVLHWLNLLVGIVLMWFVTYSINSAFWIGLAIIIFGLVVFSLGFAAMREHPERKQSVVDWGIYSISRHSHVLAGLICLLGTVVMGWKSDSVIYIMLWVYFILNIAISHLGVLSEEKLNLEKFGQEYADYMKKVPRYFFGKI